MAPTVALAVDLTGSYEELMEPPRVVDGLLAVGAGRQAQPPKPHWARVKSFKDT
jgi:hypothetical protein